MFDKCGPTYYIYISYYHFSARKRVFAPFVHRFSSTRVIRHTPQSSIVQLGYETGVGGVTCHGRVWDAKPIRTTKDSSESHLQLNATAYLKMSRYLKSLTLLPRYDHQQPTYHHVHHQKSNVTILAVVHLLLNTHPSSCPRKPPAHAACASPVLGFEGYLVKVRDLHGVRGPRRDGARRDLRRAASRGRVLPSLRYRDVVRESTQFWKPGLFAGLSRVQRCSTENRKTQLSKAPSLQGTSYAKGDLHPSWVILHPSAGVPL